LGSTPLNEAVISALDIVPEFKKEDKLQIVNAVFLTDGDADRGVRYFDNHLTRISPTRDSTLVISDPKTRNEIYISGIPETSELTSAYLTLLKKRANCNVVGFYILSGRDFTSAFIRSNYKNNVDSFGFNLDQEKKMFRKNNYRVIKNAGYDEYYLLRHEGFDDEEEFEVSETASLRSIATAFAKYTMSRKTSKIILNRFIGLIS
jgi:hypothetical protein